MLYPTLTATYAKTAGTDAVDNKIVGFWVWVTPGGQREKRKTIIMDMKYFMSPAPSGVKQVMILHFYGQADTKL